MAGQDETGISGAERRQRFEGTGELEVQVCQPHPGSDVQGRLFKGGTAEHLLCSLLQAPGEIGQVLRRHGQAGSHGMTAETKQQVSLGSDGLRDVETLHGAGGAAHRLTRRHGQDDGRLGVAFHQP